MRHIHYSDIKAAATVKGRRAIIDIDEAPRQHAARRRRALYR